jgi:hypothetical protein
MAEPQVRVLRCELVRILTVSDAPHWCRAVLLPACAALVALLLVACGEKTDTLQASGALGAAFSLVVTGSPDTIASFEKQVSSIVAGGTAQIVDGDQHKGLLICQTDVTKKGVQYHVAIYDSIVGIGITPDACAQIDSSTG